MAQGHWYVMTTTHPQEDDSSWVSDNLKVMVCIRLWVNMSIGPKIHSKATALEMWDTLKDQFSKLGLDQILSQLPERQLRHQKTR